MVSITNLTIYCHRDCASSYTSSYHINRYLKRTGSSSSSNEPLPTKRTWSDIKQFEFRENCLFCGETCALIPDPRHPDRWQKAVLCRTADHPGRQSFKEAILEACGSQKNKWARQVEVCFMGAVSNLHAADAHYHDDCQKSFISQRSVVFESKESSQCKDSTLNSAVSEMRSEKSHVWTSVKIYKTYTTHDGTNLSRAQLNQQINDMFADDLLIFSSPGLANIILFRNTA